MDKLKLSVRALQKYLRSVVSLLSIGLICLCSSVATAGGVKELPELTIDASPQYQQLHHLATEGSASAQYELGLVFEYGRAVTQNDAAAAYWYEQAAAQNYVDALYRLAILNDNGWGCPADKAKALKLYEIAAEFGHSLAQHDLAMMYFQGSGAPKSLLQAYKWLRIADINGNPLMGKHLRRVSKEMSSGDIEEAEHLARQWVANAN